MILALLLILFSDDAPKKDPTGLVIDQGLIMVQANCISCHSAAIILQTKQDRQGWQDIIKTMRDKNGMWSLDPKVEDEILTYLAKHYKPSGQFRRKPLYLPKSWTQKTKKP